MVIPHADDAENFRMTPEARAAYGRMGWRSQRRFDTTMQAPALRFDRQHRLIRPLDRTTEDGRPLFIYKWIDIYVIFSWDDDGLPLVQELYRDLDSPLPD